MITSYNFWLSGVRSWCFEAPEIRPLPAGGLSFQQAEVQKWLDIRSNDSTKTWTKAAWSLIVISVGPGAVWSFLWKCGVAEGRGDIAWLQRLNMLQHSWRDQFSHSFTVMWRPFLPECEVAPRPRCLMLSFQFVNEHFDEACDMWVILRSQPQQTTKELQEAQSQFENLQRCQTESTKKNCKLEVPALIFVVSMYLASTQRNSKVWSHIFDVRQQDAKLPVETHQSLV